jgi:hypothetical protein
VRGRRRWSTNSVTIVDYRGMSVSKVKLTFRSVVNNPLLSFVRNRRALRNGHGDACAGQWI